MKTEEEIEREFTPKGIKRAGLLLLPASEALGMIEECKRSGLQVLGIDGFILTDKATQPLMEHSLDLSEGVGDDNKIDTWKTASEFVAARSGGKLYFEVTIR